MSERIQINGNEWLSKRGIPFSPEVMGWGENEGPLDEATIVALSSLMTNVDKPVMAFTDQMPVEDSAALFARYSRSSLPLRLVYVKEFWQKGDKVSGFFERVLSGYGDDSVAQLGTVRFACEMVSQLAAKEIEDGRIGGWLEKSTRYVDFGKRVNGEFLYFRPPEIMQTELADSYTETMNEAFDLYTKAQKAMLLYIRQKYPKDSEVKEEVYKASTRAKAFDIVRVFLPMATLTNVGSVMSAQGVEGMVNKMKASNLVESQWLGEEIRQEVEQVVPALVNRNRDEKYGVEARRHLSESKLATQRVVSEMLERKGKKEIEEAECGVKLVWSGANNLEQVTAAILYPHASGVSLDDLYSLTSEMNVAEKEQLIEAYVSGRKDRRQKPGRAFEEATYAFEYVGKTAEWRDLQRHRMLTQERQLFGVDLGYETPADFFEVEIEGRRLAQIYTDHMQKRHDLFHEISHKVSADAAQYVVGFGHRHRWRMTMNLRELYHMVPLRASAAGHPDYRKIAREMFYLAAEKDPILVMPLSKFVDFSDEPRLERLQQLSRVREKQLKIGVDDADTFGEEEI